MWTRARVDNYQSDIYVDIGTCRSIATGHKKAQSVGYNSSLISGKRLYKSYATATESPRLGSSDNDVS
jgi:hypothetical protein